MLNIEATRSHCYQVSEDDQGIISECMTYLSIQLLYDLSLARSYVAQHAGKQYLILWPKTIVFGIELYSSL